MCLFCGRCKGQTNASGDALGYYRYPAIYGDTIVFTAEGDLWLNTIEGAMHVPAEEVRRVVNNPLYAVRYTLLDFLDGMPGTPADVRPMPTMAEGTDGRLWFATSNGIVWTDPRHMEQNALEPPVAEIGVKIACRYLRPHRR